jgi:ABC-type uncharacterized transport system permease subunit
MRSKLRFRTNALRFLAAAGASLLIAAVIIFFTSDEPLKALAVIITGPLQSGRKFGLVLLTAAPAIFTGLGMAVMFQTRRFNLSSDGVFYFCGAMAAYFGIEFVLPAGLHPAVGIALCGLIGAALCVLPGLLREKLGANIIVSSLMMNYILYYGGLFILRQVIRDTASGNMVSKKMSVTALLPELIPRTGIHVGVILAAAAAALCWVFLYRTRAGYEMRLTGSSEEFARYAGVNVVKTVLLAQLIGGFLAGAGSAVEIYGNYERFKWLTDPGCGWDGFIAAVLAGNNPAAVPAAALFLAWLSVGSDIAVRTCGVPPDVIPTIRGVLIILAAAQSFAPGFRRRRASREGPETEGCAHE